MKRKEGRLLLVVAVLILCIAGCSSDRFKSPITPANQTDSEIAGIEYPQNNDITNHKFSGAWGVNFDIQAMTTDIQPERIGSLHLNPLQYLPRPQITVNSYNPATHVIDVDVSIQNTTLVVGYDVRLIIFTDDPGHMLLNPDNWTALYDIPGGMDINPFVAYAKDETGRMFDVGTHHLANLLIYLPQDNTNVKFAVDASVNGNCEEPYSLKTTQLDNIYQDGSNSALISTEVKDWQNNVTEVLLKCEAITGVPEVSFSHVSGDKWKTEISNSTLTQAGEYPCLIEARSANSGSLYLYDRIGLIVFPGGAGPYNPRIVRNYRLFRNEVRHICIEGNYAYVGEDDYNNHAALKIFDISDPYEIKSLGSVDVYSVREIDKLGNCVYVAQHDHGLKIIDVTDPDNPVEAKTVYFGSGYCESVANDGCYIYTGVFYLTTYVLDVTDPYNPVIISQMNSTANDLFVRGNYLYGQAAGSGLYIYDISDPTNPVRVGRLIKNNYLFYVAVKDNYAYLCGEDKLFVIDISNPATPFEAASLVIGGQSADPAFIGNYLYIGSDEQGLCVINIEDPTNPSIETTIPIDNAFQVVRDGDKAWVTALDNGLELVDITTPATPVSLRNYPLFNPEKIENSGDYMYIGEATNGWSIMDISDREYPYRVYGDNSRSIRDIKAKGNICSLITSSSLIQVDVSDPYNPVETGSLDLPLSLESLYVYDNLAFCASISSGDTVYIVDISDPANPQLMYNLVSTGLWDLCMKDNFLYIADGSLGLLIYDISDPQNPDEVGSLFINQLLSIKIKGNCVFAGCYNKLKSIDVSNPSEPVEIDSISFEWDNSINKLEISGDYLFKVERDLYVTYLMTFNISDPNNLTLMNSLEFGTRYGDYDPAAADNYLYLATQGDDYNGLPEGIIIVKLW
jgi:hypothetical protein